MQPILHPSGNGAGLSRMVGWSAALHLLVLTALVAADLVRPRPTVFRDVIRVDLVAPQPQKAVVVPRPEPEPEPEPEKTPPPKPALPPLKQNPLWAKLDQMEPPPPPRPDKQALSEMWNKVAKTPPKPEPKPRKPPEDLKQWWNKEMAQASQVPPATAPEPVRIPERKRLAETWKQINAGLPEAVRIAEAEGEGQSQGELANWWKRQMDMAAPEGARMASAASKLGTPQYRALVEQRVASRWSPPDIFRDRKAVTVVLAFDLLPDGHVRSVKVVRSSGSNFYDQAALRAIFLSDPFPAFPKELEEPSIEIRMTFALDRGRLG